MGDELQSYVKILFFEVDSICICCKSQVIPLQIPCKSHFPPILRNRLGTDLKRTWNGSTTDLQRRHIFNVISMKKGKRIYEINAETQRRGDYFLLNTEDTE